MIRLGKANRKVTKALPANRWKIGFQKMLNLEKITLSTKFNGQGRPKPKLHLPYQKIATRDTPSNREQLKVPWDPEHSTVGADLSKLLLSLQRPYQTCESQAVDMPLYEQRSPKT
ncbi:hypothetical protein EAF00_007753 [Botryotinia globosa]|nr:hypothetical protein EAF00_007753 [Botryotinia globosa]